MTDAKLFIRMQIERDRLNKRIFIHQSSYILSHTRKVQFCESQKRKHTSRPSHNIYKQWL